MKIVVINLASEERRWEAVRGQLRAVGLEPVRSEAVRGAELPRERIERLYDARLNARLYHKPLKPGEIGCYASHIAAWQRLLESGDRQLAVFEDDVDIDPDLPKVLDALGRTPDDWDMVKLIGRRRERTQTIRSMLTPDRELVAYRRIPGLTCAYVINRRGAEKLLRSRVPFGRPIDIDLRHWWECDLRIRGVLPYPVHAAPSSLVSTIEGRRAPRDLETRLRKFFFQARYCMSNWNAALAGSGAAPARRRRDLADHAAP